ncbi:acyl-CoA dehydrogenase family protein [Priestia abyssalis]|uniref:acyl-CoA dehydrogenase family protein n=1 Tax=Priestia abyssalis TaxID=1221450 RepID=UPI0009957BCB|nr:acyl-CoA dehydrogenase family protein [Priestia abyssalis]
MTISFVRTKEQQERYKMIEELADEFAKHAQEIDEKGVFPHENIEKLKRSGYTKWTLPQSFEGSSISLYEMLLYQERLAKGDASTALSIGWHLGIVMDLWEKQNWNETALDWMMNEVACGALLNSAATEPQTGSPTRGGKPQTTAQKTETGWLLNGRKTFTTMSPALDYFLVKASIQGTDEVGNFIVPRHVEGVSIEETWDMIAMRGTGSHDLLLKNVRLTKESLAEKITAQQKLKPNGWLLHIPACYMGIALAARDYAVEFASSYSPNSIVGTIKELPNVQRLVGEIELELINARHFMYAVAEKWDRSENREGMQGELTGVKHVVTNAAVSVVDKAMRIVGARSLHRSNPLQRYYRDVRAGLHNPPMDDMTIMHLAKQAFRSR